MINISFGGFACKIVGVPAGMIAGLICTAGGTLIYGTTVYCFDDFDRVKEHINNLISKIDPANLIITVSEHFLAAKPTR